MMTNILCIFFIFTVVLKEYSCNPTTDCINANGVGELVPDPVDCHKYFVCIESEDSGLYPSDSSFTCPSGEYFEQSSASCEQERIKGKCNTGIYGWQDVLNECSITCYELFGNVGNPNNCSSYFICLSGGGRSETDCTVDFPYFNGVDCGTDVSKCCDFCSPTCFASGTEIPDPFDCKSYYICTDLGPALEDLHLTCPAGQYFDIEQVKCITGNNCQNICSGTRSTTTKAPLTTSPVACHNKYNCVTDGNFPRCIYCDPSYFHCQGGNATIGYCTEGTVFNTNPSYPKCVDPAQCPTSGP